MHGYFVCLLAVFCAVILVDAEALRIRIRGRRIWRRIKRPVCRAACTYTCSAATEGVGTPVCGLVCHKVCGKIRRSSEQDVFADKKVTIPLPGDFDLYDKNEDGTVQIEEFAELIGLEASRSDVIETFSLADSDDDSLISEVELLEAPWLFESEDPDVPPRNSDETPWSVSGQ